jgi:hypothetical protein
MAWVLVSGKTKVRWRGQRVFGRSDFRDQKSLSRLHFELYEEAGRVFLKDLGSTNGTHLGQDRLKAEEPIALSENEPFSVSSNRFHIERLKWHDFGFSNLKYDGCLFGGLLALILLQPGNHFGIALGLVGFLMVFFSLAFAFAISVAVLRTAFHYSSHHISAQRLKRAYAVYSGAAFVLSLLVNHAFLTIFILKFGSMKYVITSKIEYYCLANFSHGDCVLNVNLCPDCALELEKYKRDKIVESLKKYRATYPPVAQAQLKAIAEKSQRQPASENSLANPSVQSRPKAPANSQKK